MSDTETVTIKPKDNKLKTHTLQLFISLLMFSNIKTALFRIIYNLTSKKKWLSLKFESVHFTATNEINTVNENELHYSVNKEVYNPVNYYLNK